MVIPIRILTCCLFLFVAAGCVRAPVQHLASDASLITPGASTKTDVLTYLGNPDEREAGTAESERWYYYGQERSNLQRTLYIGQWFGPKSYSRIVVTFAGELVTDIEYNASETDDFKRVGTPSGQEQQQ